MTRVFLDENISPNLCLGLHALQQSLNHELEDPIEVLSIKTEFGRGALDEEWIPELGRQRAMVITQDINITRTRHQRALCQEFGVGLVIMRPPSKKKGMRYWEQVRLLVNNWEGIVKVASRKSGHFHFELKNKSGLKEL